MNFIVQCNNIEGRLDPHFYKPEYKAQKDKLQKSKNQQLNDIVEFSNETWDQKSGFKQKFPYIEISEIDIVSGEIKNINYYEVKGAPSRAKMIVRDGDIIVSTTRPHRGAIARITTLEDGFIASTGFAILRKLKTGILSKDCLFHLLRTDFLLMQMLQRSSGGNYPAITAEELKKLILPIPPTSVQEEIVKIMQSAYEQRKQSDEKADILLDSIYEYILNELGIKVPEIRDKKYFIVWNKEITGQRIDPNKYLDKPKAILEAIAKSKYKLKRLSEIIINSTSGEWGEDKHGEFQQNNYVLCKVLRNTNFDNKYNLNFEDIAERLIPKDKFEKVKLKTGDILIEKSGGSPIQPVGRVALVEDIDGNYAFSNFLLCVKVNTTECLPDYLFAYLKALYSLNYMEYLQNQTTGIKNLIMEEYFSIPVPMPPKENQLKIAKEIKSRMETANKLKKEANNIIEEAKQTVERMATS